jgi:raffinose/stachyose/melibiose transport system substrate-binding protein
MLADAWTAQAPLAPLTAVTAPDDFFEARFAGDSTFSEGWREAAEKELELYQYTQPNPAGFGYQEGTQAFAEGQSAMLLLGSYAVPQIRRSAASSPSSPSAASPCRRRTTPRTPSSSPVSTCS